MPFKLLCLVARNSGSWILILLEASMYACVHFVLPLSCASRDLAVYLHSLQCGSQMSDIFTVSENSPERELARRLNN